jgi:hypothetical protein
MWAAILSRISVIVSFPLRTCNFATVCCFDAIGLNDTIPDRPRSRTRYSYC